MVNCSFSEILKIKEYSDSKAKKNYGFLNKSKIN